MCQKNKPRIDEIFLQETGAAPVRLEVLSQDNWLAVRTNEGTWVEFRLEKNKVKARMWDGPGEPVQTVRVK